MCSWGSGYIFKTNLIYVDINVTYLIIEDVVSGKELYADLCTASDDGCDHDVGHADVVCRL